MANIVILGSGGFGLSLAVIAEKSGVHNVTVWSKFQEEIEDIRKHGEHIHKLPGVPVSEKIALTSDISCIKGCDILIFGIPSSFLRDVAKLANPYIDDKMVIVNTSKGLEEKTLKRMSEVISEEINTDKLVVLSGPSHAEEVARGIPTTLVASSQNRSSAEYIQEQLGMKSVRIYVSDDVVGCEIGGATKNIIALCAGICDGMGYGDNTKAALMTRGIHEIVKLGVFMGAKMMTFSGLTGLGDLIVTCTSMHSRNRRAGILIGEGVSPQKAVERVGTVEGYYCCKATYELAKKIGVEMPITEQLYDVLFMGKNPREALDSLMERPQIHESIEL